LPANFVTPNYKHRSRRITTQAGEELWNSKTNKVASHIAFAHAVDGIDELKKNNGGKESMQQTRTVEWKCPVCQTELESEVEAVTSDGYRCLEDPLACPRCGRFTAIFNFETNRVEARKD
jgi:rubrerythrin